MKRALAVLFGFCTPFLLAATIGNGTIGSGNGGGGGGGGGGGSLPDGGSSAQVLHGPSGTAVWGPVGLTTDVTGVLAPLNGGTGTTSFVQNGVVYGAGDAGLLVTAQGAANSVLVGNGAAPSFTTTPTVGGLTSTGIISSAPILATDDVMTMTVTTGGAARFTGTLTEADLTGNVSWTMPPWSGQPVALTSVCTTGQVPTCASNGAAVPTWSTPSAGGISGATSGQVIVATAATTGTSYAGLTYAAAAGLGVATGSSTIGLTVTQASDLDNNIALTNLHDRANAVSFGTRSGTPSASDPSWAIGRYPATPFTSWALSAYNGSTSVYPLRVMPTTYFTGVSNFNFAPAYTLDARSNSGTGAVSITTTDTTNGVEAQLTAFNMAASGSSHHARFLAYVENAQTGGSPFSDYLVNGGKRWVVGSNHAASDTFGVWENSSPGTNPGFTIAPTTRAMNVANTLTVSSAVTKPTCTLSSGTCTATVLAGVTCVCSYGAVRGALPVGCTVSSTTMTATSDDAVTAANVVAICL